VESLSKFLKIVRSPCYTFRTRIIAYQFPRSFHISRSRNAARASPKSRVKFYTRVGSLPGFDIISTNPLDTRISILVGVRVYIYCTVIDCREYIGHGCPTVAVRVLPEGRSSAMHMSPGQCPRDSRKGEVLLIRTVDKILNRFPSPLVL